MIDERNAEKWVERFMNGETTNAEEQQLYSFFAGKNVPRRLEKYKPMFHWYAGGMQEPITPVKKRFRFGTFTLSLSVAASALIILGAAAWLYESHEGSTVKTNPVPRCAQIQSKTSDIKTNTVLVNKVRATQPELLANEAKAEVKKHRCKVSHIDHEMYEGSYIIRNGKKITDLDEIMPELEKTMAMAVEQQRELDKNFSAASEKEKEAERSRQLAFNRSAKVIIDTDEKFQKEQEQIHQSIPIIKRRPQSETSKAFTGEE